MFGFLVIIKRVELAGKIVDLIVCKISPPPTPPPIFLDRIARVKRTSRIFFLQIGRYRHVALTSDKISFEQNLVHEDAKQFLSLTGRGFIFTGCGYYVNVGGISLISIAAVTLNRINN